jgi:hypothetical protein
MPALRKASGGGPYALCVFLRMGAVAQLGERQNRTLEVAGSIPVCSTKEGVNLIRLTPFSFDCDKLTIFSIISSTPTLSLNDSG